MSSVSLALTIIGYCLGVLAVIKLVISKGKKIPKVQIFYLLTIGMLLILASAFIWY